MQLGVVTLLALLHIYVGIEARLYWTHWWWDIPLHVLGGLWAGLFGAWVLTIFDTRSSLTRCVLAAFLLGTTWEVFEYGVFGANASPFMSYPLDTAKDLFNDVLGGLVAGLLVERMRT